MAIDLLVIGGGVHGLIMAKTYQEVAPSSRVLVVDSAASIGGVWARERLYPGLKTNNIVGTYELSDFPLDLAKYTSLRPGQHIPGETVQHYLEDVCTHYQLDVRLETTVVSMVEEWKPEENKSRTRYWKVQYRDPHTDCGVLWASHVVVATGLTSEPKMPSFPGQMSFHGLLFHARDLHRYADELQRVRGDVVVVGSNKSAWDVCYLVAASKARNDPHSHARVHMLVRPGGRGPSWVWRRLPWCPWFSISRMAATRMFTWFDGSPLVAEADTTPSAWKCRWRWLWRSLSFSFWKVLDWMVWATTGYGASWAQNLRPWTSTFWMGNTLGIHNYDTDWFDLVRRGRIVVHHAEIGRLVGEGGGGTVHLSGGTVLSKVDAVVACTGWQYMPSIALHDVDVLEKKESDTRKNENDNENDNDNSETSLLQPPKLPLRPHLPPLYLYRFILPIQETPPPSSDPNLAFIGFYQSLHTTIIAQAQALWITALFRGSLAQTVKDKGVDHEASWTRRHTAYQQQRRLGAPFPDLLLDGLAYVDLLLADVGLAAVRKNGWRNVWEAHRPEDYRGLVQEWVEKEDQKRRRGNSTGNR